MAVRPISSTPSSAIATKSAASSSPPTWHSSSGPRPSPAQLRRCPRRSLCPALPPRRHRRRLLARCSRLRARRPSARSRQALTPHPRPTQQLDGQISTERRGRLLSTTMRYMHLSPGATEGAIRLLDERPVEARDERKSVETSWRREIPMTKYLAISVTYSAERQGFEPWIELLALYSLSRRAPSTTRPSLLHTSYSLFTIPPASSAEEVGFEPTGRFRPAVFKTAALNHSATPPCGV
jgi:hypothetical protein